MIAVIGSRHVSLFKWPAIWGHIWKGTVKKSQTNLRLAICCRKEGGTGRLFCWVLLVFVGSRQEQYMLDFLHCALSNCLPGKIHNQTGCTSLNCFSNVTCCRVVAWEVVGSRHEQCECMFSLGSSVVPPTPSTLQTPVACGNNFPSVQQEKESLTLSLVEAPACFVESEDLMGPL